MYISQIDIIKQKLSAANDLNISNIIKDIIAEHEKSPKFTEMQKAQKYFDGEHDILEKDFRKSYVYKTEDENGFDDANKDKTEMVYNPNNSNHHNVHNYFRQLVEQEADYVAGNPPAVVVEGAGTDPNSTSPLKAFENDITAVTSDELFARLIADTIIDTRVNGRSFIHPYVSESGQLATINLNPLEVIPIYDTAYQTEILEFLRYYKITVVRGSQPKQITRVEWWTADDVTYFLEDDNHDYAKESFADGKPNPAPHYWEVGLLNPETQKNDLTPKSFGRVPLVEVAADKTRSSLLNKIKGLQDAYNLLSSKLANDEIDLVALFWTIQGYGGESASKIRKKLEMNKGISIDDPDGKINAQQVELNTSERIAFLDLLKRDIFRLGEGLVHDIERSGNVNTTELKMRYADLRNKANRMVRELKIGLKYLFQFIVDDINNTNGKGYDYKLVKAEFHYNEVTNDTELVDNILKLRGFVPDTMLMSLVPYVDDPNEAWIELQKQLDTESKRKADAYEVPRNRNVDGKILQGASQA